MNRREFMNRLEQLLQGLSEDEKKDALQYYEDYFEDAGPACEQDVIRNLGSPDNVAKTIWEDARQTEWSQANYNGDSVNYQQNGNYEKLNYQNQKKKESNWIIIIILLVTSPITIPAIFSVLGAILSFIIGIAGCIIGFPIAAIGMFIGAVVLFSMGLTGFALLCMGFAFGFLCVEFLLVPLLGWICGTVIPAFYKWCKHTVMNLMNKGGSRV